MEEEVLYVKVEDVPLTCSFGLGRMAHSYPTCCDAAGSEPLARAQVRNAGALSPCAATTSPLYAPRYFSLADALVSSSSGCVQAHRVWPLLAADAV